MKSFKRRREIVESIPSDTFYCYLPDEKRNKKESSSKYYYSLPCPFYIHKKGLVGKCKLYKVKIIDQVKICGLKEKCK